MRGNRIDCSDDNIEYFFAEKIGQKISIFFEKCVSFSDFIRSISKTGERHEKSIILYPCYGIYLMDPNHNDSIQLATYGSEYEIGGVAYSWDQTLRRVITSSTKNLE